ncbi:hypothetical protein SEA_CHRIDISON_39 [Arthrobacter phage Chridison]|uniref:Uncharacterized protein n=2 Tax=Korravirus hunterdalle TaxID=1982080 RepID=A0A0U4JQS7_9CAUD|nr:hypothetical protein FDH58_gp40 [Arthrobacter phage HunterDalle]ALY09190.1 hypothetical protein HUNTERDALLE_40 [Arthrobacter phage HunterDalle]ALY10705.1 hypothetical protein VULTURE_40 [Arthrobacter phage Vulture]WAB09092.1 hypothetical protein SEA_CHRIDISON_39 [Arthrobacter phage Chridison]
MTATPSDDDNYNAFISAFGVAPPGQEQPSVDLGPRPEDFNTPQPSGPRESHAGARIVGQRAGDYLREFMANGFTREEALMYIAQMLPHYPH